MHYRAQLAPFLTLGLIDALIIIRKNSPKLIVPLVLLLFLSSLLQQYYFHFPLNKLTKSEFYTRADWMENSDRLIDRIPKVVSLAAQQNLVPHLSQRQYIYLIYARIKDIPGITCPDKLCWWLDFAGNPDYLLIDTRPHQWLTQILESNENWQEAISNMEKSGAITVADEEGSVRLYKVNWKL